MYSKQQAGNLHMIRILRRMSIMFTSIKDFSTVWNNESAATQLVMNALTDASLHQEITPSHRNLGQLAWHLVTTIHEMLSRTGLQFESPGDEAHIPSSAKAIAEAYQRTGQAMLDALHAQWTDASVAASTEMYGEVWPNGLTLHILIQHEIHHRGQMTVLMRQAGLRVPSIYGPTLEDWQERGQ
jgi:uncharacterized damage-inducible protein DinB